ncbi:hypothetical protein ACV3SO_13815 [Clostridium perfringens]|nr:hypothetical protein [Clostridium perfringens]MDM0964124.1 hypothetical protein [Clostridium perfringens]
MKNHLNLKIRSEYSKVVINKSLLARLMCDIIEEKFSEEVYSYEEENSCA